VVGCGLGGGEEGDGWWVVLGLFLGGFEAGEWGSWGWVGGERGGEEADT